MVCNFYGFTFQLSVYFNFVHLSSILLNFKVCASVYLHGVKGKNIAVLSYRQRSTNVKERLAVAFPCIRNSTELKTGRCKFTV